MQIPRITAAASELGQIDARIWQHAPSRRIRLIGTPVALQPSAYITDVWRDKSVGRIEAVDFSALHNGEAIALRLSWAAPRPTATLTDNDSFADGAAVMFPIGEDAPLVTMGSPEQPVNAWHWRADRPQTAHSNVASGLGSTRVSPGVEILTRAQHSRGRWHLIFLRRLGIADDKQASSVTRLEAGGRNRIAFAVWDGSAGERAGLKAFSPEWLDVALA
ncbi:ethylbenzene dehydrogenase-related protein [Sterolibacterium denitrificans]|nr:ethylbenzene dehydrogenase-related protein [Sterolibacterium denitrificans]